MAEFNCNFFERGMDLLPLLEQADANTTITGDWIKMAHYDRCLLVVAKYGSEDVDTLGIQVVQATDNAAAGSKGVSALYQYWYKQGTLTSQATWTYGQLTTADDVLGVGSSAPTSPAGTLIVATDTNTDAFILAIDFRAEYLDANNNFDFITVQLDGGEVNNSILISAWAIPYGGHYPQNNPLTPLS